jgi:hypothetical protein
MVFKRSALAHLQKRSLGLPLLMASVLLVPAEARGNEGSTNVLPARGYQVVAYDAQDAEMAVRLPSNIGDDPQSCAAVDETNSSFLMEFDGGSVTIGNTTVQGPYSAIVRYVPTETVYEGPNYVFNDINWSPPSAAGCPLSAASLEGNGTVHFTLESFRGTDDGLPVQDNRDTLDCSSNTTGNGEYLKVANDLTLRFIDNVTCTASDGSSLPVTDTEVSVAFALRVPLLQCVGAINPSVCRVQGTANFG